MRKNPHITAELNGETIVLPFKLFTVERFGKEHRVQKANDIIKVIATAVAAKRQTNLAFPAGEAVVLRILLDDVLLYGADMACVLADELAEARKENKAAQITFPMIRKRIASIFTEAAIAYMYNMRWEPLSWREEIDYTAAPHRHSMFRPL